LRKARPSRAVVVLIGANDYGLVDASDTLRNDAAPGKMKTAEGAAVFEGMKLGEVGSPDIGARCQRRSHSYE
jgi:hypothetical protein